MIGGMIALLLGGSSALAGANPGPAELPDLFVAACLDGEATLSPGEAAAIGFNGLPQDLQKRLGNPSSAQVWRLSGGGQAYLYVLDYAPARNTSPRVCGVASDAMNYSSAADVVEQRVTGAVYPRTTRSIEWLDPKGGYNALATTAGDFKVLQINWLSDDQKRVIQKGYETPQH
jgi:hypothetical protein